MIPSIWQRLKLVGIIILEELPAILIRMLILVFIVWVFITVLR